MDQWKPRCRHWFGHVQWCFSYLFLLGPVWKSSKVVQIAMYDNYPIHKAPLYINVRDRDHMTFGQSSSCLLCSIHQMYGGKNPMPSSSDFCDLLSRAKTHFFFLEKKTECLTKSLVFYYTVCVFLLLIFTGTTVDKITYRPVHD